MSPYRSLLLCGLMLLSGVPSAWADSMNCSAAVSLREAVTDAAEAFESQTGNHVNFTFGASGQLSTQIQNGAPVDLFISAANKQVDDLSKAGVVDDNTRRVVAHNDLVLVVPADAVNPPASFAQLKQDSIKKIAIGEPKTVPAGQYAMQTLTALKLDEILKPRLIYGSSVRQVLDYVERGEVSAGIVYATDAKESKAKVKVIATADASTHEPIVYPAIIIKASKKKTTASQFLDFLQGEKGRAAFATHGFTDGKAEPPATKPAK